MLHVLHVSFPTGHANHLSFPFISLYVLDAILCALCIHFLSNSMYAVSKAMFKDSKAEVVVAAANAIKKIKKVYFAVYAKNERGSRETSIIVMCGNKNNLKLYSNKFKEDGYKISGSLDYKKYYNLREGKEIKVRPELFS